MNNKKFLFCSKKKISLITNVGQSAGLQANPRDGMYQKSEPDIKLWGGPTRLAFCGPKCEAG